MIRITVTGDTFTHRKTLKDNHYDWNKINKSWSKIVGEASLDYHINQIRPPVTESDEEMKIIVELREVDTVGNPLSPTVMRINLKSMARPGETIAELFAKEFSVISVPPIQLSPDPIISKKEEKKDKYKGFF